MEGGNEKNNLPLEPCRGSIFQAVGFNSMNRLQKEENFAKGSPLFIWANDSCQSTTAL